MSSPTVHSAPSNRHCSIVKRPARSTQQIRETIAANIDLAHKLSDNTVAAVLRAMDIERTTFWRWRRGVIRPSDEHLEELAVVYDRSLSWFFDDHSNCATSTNTSTT